MRSNINQLQPVKRSALRLACGRVCYTGMRYLLWYSGRFRFARELRTERLPYSCFAHSSLLLRRLRDVDMQYQYNKIQNLRAALPRLNGLVLNPGETFSYWRCLGRPTKRKGYVEGMVLHCGSFGPGIGGGLCQLSNLLFWMALHTPLTVVERYRHSYDVFPDAGRTVPFGSGATCVYPYRDLMVRNDTPYRWQLHLWLDETHLRGEWLCEKPFEIQYKIKEKNHYMQPEYWGGYSRHNELWRESIDLNGNLLENKKLFENHALMMYSPFIENVK